MRLFTASAEENKVKKWCSSGSGKRRDLNSDHAAKREGAADIGGGVNYQR